MNITIGSDHGAVELKDEVKMVLHEFSDVKVKDVGTFGKEAVDYPDIAEKVCADVVSGKADRGIVLCGTGTLYGCVFGNTVTQAQRCERACARRTRHGGWSCGRDRARMDAYGVRGGASCTPRRKDDGPAG